MADDITRHPETGWKERLGEDPHRLSHRARLRRRARVAGLKTAFVARYRKGTLGPNLGVIVEYDALRGTSRDFHGDQHSAKDRWGWPLPSPWRVLTSSKTPGTVTVTAHRRRARVARREDGHLQCGRFQGGGRPDPLAFVDGEQAPGPAFGSCCMNINGRALHLLRRPGAPAAGVGRTRRADGRDRAVQSHRRPAQDGAPGDQDPAGSSPRAARTRTSCRSRHGGILIRYPDPVYLRR